MKFFNNSLIKLLSPSLLALTPTLTVVHGHRVSGGCHACHEWQGHVSRHGHRCDDAHCALLTSLLRSARAMQGSLARPRWETQDREGAEQSRVGPSAVHITTLGCTMGYRAFEKQATHSSSISRSEGMLEHLVEMNQAVDAWSLRPPVWSGAGQCTIAPVASSASGANSGAAQVSLGSVATTLHTDTQSSWAKKWITSTSRVWRSVFIL